MASWLRVLLISLGSVVCGQSAMTSYTVHRTPLSFDQAVDRCRPGVLATLATGRQVADVLRLVSESPPSRDEFTFWIGLKKDRDRCVVPTLPLRGFQWTEDGSQDSLVHNWTTEPQSTCTSIRCGALSGLRAESRLVRWGLLSITCKNSHPFICKHRDTFRPGPPQPEPSKPGPYQPEPSKPGPYQPEPSKPGPYQQEPSKPGPYQPEPSKPGPYQQEPSKPGPYQPEPSKPGPYQPEPSKPGPYQPEPSKPGPYQPEPSKPGPPQPEPSKPGPYQPELPDSRIELQAPDPGPTSGPSSGFEPSSGPGSGPSMWSDRCQKNPVVHGARSLSPDPTNSSRIQVECWSSVQLQLYCRGRPPLWRLPGDAPADLATVCRPCPDGFHKDPSGTCVDVDECSGAPCRRTCLNTEGSYRCVCADEDGRHHDDGSPACVNAAAVAEGGGALSGVLVPVLVAVAVLLVLALVAAVTVRCCLMRRAKKREAETAEKMAMEHPDARDSFVTTNEKRET